MLIFSKIIFKFYRQNKNTPGVTSWMSYSGSLPKMLMEQIYFTIVVTMQDSKSFPHPPTL